MTNPTDTQLIDGLGLAHGFAADHDPTAIVDNPRRIIAHLLNWPEPLVSPAHILAYFDGLQSGRDHRRTLDSYSL